LSGLDPRKRRAIRAAYKRPNAGPHRRFVGSLTPIGRMDPCDDMTPLLQAILTRIQRYRHQTVAGAYVLGDEDGNVYVLAEGANTTAGLVEAHMAWYVGSYARGDKPVFPTVADLLDDLRAHFANLVPALVYDAIRSVEG
jgi:hypothetical protein